MKNKTLILFFAALLAIGSLILPTPAIAQTATTATTLAAAINDTTSNTITLTSATNVSANGFLYVDRETMTVLSSYVSGTTVPVARGAAGTKATKHKSLAPVYVFAPGNQGRVGLRSGPQPGSEPAGACTATDEPLLPVFNTTLGTRYDCLNGQWVKTGVTGSVIFCGATTGTTTCTPATGIAARSIGGIATLASNSAVISGISPAFTSTSTFSCVGQDITTRANPVQVVQTSSSSITITNTTGASDVINWQCVGY